MLKYLKLESVGPGSEMEMELASRLNLITGDNGLGKSFLLDWAWRCLTRTWAANREIIPPKTSGRIPLVGFSAQSRSSETEEGEFRYDFKVQGWTQPASPAGHGALVIYARVGGGFSVWDPTRRVLYNQDNLANLPQGLRLMAAGSSTHHFSKDQVFNGFAADENTGEIACRGLVADWVKWQDRSGKYGKWDPFAILANVLKTLSPSKNEIIRPGDPTRVSISDSRDIPTIVLPYESVPVIYASAAIRRILSLAYLLVWTWDEHLNSCKILGIEPTGELVLLVDEIEAHLYPRWQQTILPALLQVADRLSEDLNTQFIATSHAPLILSSAEPFFDPNRDAWFDLDFIADQREVVLEKKQFVRRGTVGRWLMSPAFDLPSEGRSREAELAIAKAEKLLERRNNGEKLEIEDIDEVDKALRSVLSDVDRFWVRWQAAVESLKEPQ